MERNCLKDMKRLLEPFEIDHILFCIFKQYIHSKVDESIFFPLRDSMRKTLEKIKCEPCIIPSLIEEMDRQVSKCIAKPGESVGIIASQSIGERQTQMTLNTFHTAGESVSTVIQGVPRFTELLNATKNPKLTFSFIYLKFQKKSISEFRDSITPIMDITLRQLCSKKTIIKTDQLPSWASLYEKIFHKPIQLDKWCIVITLNKKCIVEHQLDLQSIIDAIENERPEIQCLLSPDMTELFLVLNTFETEYAGEQREQREMMIIEHEVIPDLLKLYVSGIDIHQKIKKKIIDVQLVKLKNSKDYIENGSPVQEWILKTQGSNLEKIFLLDYIEPTKCYSNNVWEILELLGVEASYYFLVQEFYNTVCDDGGFVNKAHIHVIISIMTFHGSVTSISRYGMKHDLTGVLGKCSFEESVENFFQSALFAKKDDSTGISASIILGKKGNIGSNLCTLLPKL